MSDFDKTLHAQLRHLIDDLTVAVDDDGHTRYAPKNTLMFSNFIGALIELMPTLAARAQPAQAVPVLSDGEMEAVIRPFYRDSYAASMAMLNGIDEYRAVEQAVRAKMGVAVPMTDGQALDSISRAKGIGGVIRTDGQLFALVREVERHHGIGVQPQHITDGSPCWCNPDVAYTDPETGASVIVHRRPQ